MLRESGIKLKTPSKKYAAYTFLELAVLDGEIQLVMNLLNFNSDPNKGDFKPLHIACKDSKISDQIINVLLNYDVINKDAIKIDLYCINKEDQMTPLELALEYQNKPAVKLLVDKMLKKVEFSINPLMRNMMEAIEILLAFDEFDYAFQLLLLVCRYVYESGKPPPLEESIRLRILRETLKQFPEYRQGIIDAESLFLLAKAFSENTYDHTLFKKKFSQGDKTWFDGCVLNLDSCIKIHDVIDSYLLVLADDMNQQSRYHFSDTCIKRRKTSTERKVVCAVNGEAYNFEISHELMAHDSKDRIMIARRTSDDGDAMLYVAVKRRDIRKIFVLDDLLQQNRKGCGV